MRIFVTILLGLLAAGGSRTWAQVQPSTKTETATPAGKTGDVKADRNASYDNDDDGLGEEMQRPAPSAPANPQAPKAETPAAPASPATIKPKSVSTASYDSDDDGLEEDPQDMHKGGKKTTPPPPPARPEAATAPPASVKPE